MADFLSDVDAAFLRADTSTQHLHVLATLVLDGSTLEGETPYGLFQRRLRERAPMIEALRRRPQRTPFGDTVWVDDPLADIERHLHHVVVEGGGHERLAEWAGRIASTDLPKDRPLWEAWLIEGLDDDRIGVIARVHHAAVDGVSGIWALAAFFDLDPVSQSSPLAVPYAPPPPATPREVVTTALERVRSRPADVVRRTGRVARTATAMLRASATETPAPGVAPRLPFNGPLTPRREVAFAEASLDDLKDVRRAFGVTINEVIVGLVAGIVRRRLLADGVEVDKPLVAAVPVSEREAEHGFAGNRLSFMLCHLPADVADPGDRLAAAQRSSSAAKALYEASGKGLLADLATLAPRPLVGPMMSAVSALGLARVVPPIANVIVSNVRGPDFPLYVAGTNLEGMFPMGPLMEGVGLGITIVTYRDRVEFGFVACPDLLADVSGLAASVADEIGELRAAASA